MHCNRRGPMIGLFQNVLFIQLSLIFFHPFLFILIQKHRRVRHKMSGLFPAAQELLDWRWAGYLYNSPEPDRAKSQCSDTSKKEEDNQSNPWVTARARQAIYYNTSLLKFACWEIRACRESQAAQKRSREIPSEILCPLAGCPHKALSVQEVWGTDRKSSGTWFSRQNGQRARARGAAGKPIWI